MNLTVLSCRRPSQKDVMKRGWESDSREGSETAVTKKKEREKEREKKKKKKKVRKTTTSK